jgi:hypothetical protein
MKMKLKKNIKLLKWYTIESNFTRLSKFKKNYVISYPKSGRTWVRVMLGQMGINPYYTHDDSGTIGIGVSNNKEIYKNKKVLFIIRNPKDVIVSSYFQQTKRRKNYNGTIQNFIRDKKFGVQSILKFYDIWYENKETPKNFLIIKYEGLKQDPEVNMRKILKFFNKNVSDEKLRKAIKFAEFENMKKLEKKGYFLGKFGKNLYTANPQDSESFHTRKGKVGGYIEYLNPEDIEYCNVIIKQSKNDWYND